MITLERGLGTYEVLRMVVTLSELTGVASTLSVMAGDSSPAKITEIRPELTLLPS
jgi:hypothetical protein